MQTLGEAVVARSGDVVFIECFERLSDAGFERAKHALGEELAGTNVRGILMPPGLRLVKIDHPDIEGVE